VFVTFMWVLLADERSVYALTHVQGMGSLRLFLIFDVNPGTNTVEHLLQVIRLAVGSLIISYIHARGRRLTV
jgi:hypothetical protein